MIGWNDALEVSFISYHVVIFYHVIDGYVG